MGESNRPGIMSQDHGALRFVVQQGCSDLSVQSAGGDRRGDGIDTPLNKQRQEVKEETVRRLMNSRDRSAEQCCQRGKCVVG